MRPNFKDIDIKNAGFAATNAAEWAKANGIEANWKTPEHINVKPVYTKEDLEGMEHLRIWYSSLSAWSVQRHVSIASLDNPSVCRFLYS